MPTTVKSSPKWYPQVPAHTPVQPEQLNGHLRWLTDQTTDAQTAFISLMAKIQTGTGATGTIAASGTATVTIKLPNGYNDTNYVVNANVEGSSLQVVNVLRSKTTVQVTVKNTDAGAGHAGTVMVWAYHP